MQFQGLTLEALVYLLCMITSLVCLALVARAYRSSRVRLLFWTALSFVAMALNNFLLVVDKVFTGPDVDLRPVRTVFHLLALAVLIYGFVWETDQ